MCDCWFKVVPVELVICVGIVETCRSTFFGCMNDLKTLCNWPSHVWWHIVFYRLGLSDPACQITLETAHYFHLCFTAVIVRFHSTAVKSAWVCLEWNWKLTASHFGSHELIVVLGNFEHMKWRDTVLTLWKKPNTFWCLHAAHSQALRQGRGLFIQNSSQQHLHSTCMRVFAADYSSDSIQTRKLLLSSSGTLMSWRKCPPSGPRTLLSSVCDIECIPGVHLRVSVVAAAGI